MEFDFSNEDFFKVNNDIEQYEFCDEKTKTFFSEKKKNLGLINVNIKS